MASGDIDERMVADRLASTEPRGPLGHRSRVTFNDVAGAVDLRPHRSWTEHPPADCAWALLTTSRSFDGPLACSPSVDTEPTELNRHDGYDTNVARCATRYAKLVIASFRHKGLKALFETGSAAGVHPNHAARLRMQLTALDTAHVIDDMNLPGFRLHPLKGTMAGRWSITVSGNWRMTFEFREGNAYVLDYEDYH
jgi:toxin HigB-1